MVFARVFHGDAGSDKTAVEWMKGISSKGAVKSEEDRSKINLRNLSLSLHKSSRSEERV